MSMRANLVVVEREDSSRGGSGLRESGVDQEQRWRLLMSIHGQRQRRKMWSASSVGSRLS